MNIAFITSGLLPLPATKGGAIETLLDSFVKENENSNKNVKITIYSIYDKTAKKRSKILDYSKTKYIYISCIGNFVVKAFNKLFKKNVPINFFYQKMVVKKINKKSYDYIIVENYPELILKLKSKRVIPYIHSDVFNRELTNSLEILNKCYKVITVSNFIKSRVIEIDKSQAYKVITVYNSIDFKNLDFGEKEKLRNLNRKIFNISENDIVYAFSGRLSKEKGALECLRAFNKTKVPNKKLLIIGGIWYTSKKKNAYLNELQNISNDDVIFTGYIKHEDMQGLLYSVDIGIVPSICNEAAGLSVVEFMNTNSFVIASDKGGIKEYLNHKDNFLVKYVSDEQFVDDLAIKMEMAYHKIKDDSTIGERNYLYSRKFSTNENYQNIVNILEGDQ